jgi:TPR repeat protein
MKRRTWFVFAVSLVVSSPALFPPCAGAQQIGACFSPAQYRSPDPVAEANFQQGVSYFEQQQWAAARQYLGVASQHNHPRAQELMSQIFIFGYGVPIDTLLGFRYLSAAAAQGHRGAIADLGFYYSQVVGDLSRADQYLLAAARCGSVDAQTELGLNYEFGRGVPRDRQQAVHWLLIAAQQSGQAAFVAKWLQKPNTPHFENADQLGTYVGIKIKQSYVIPMRPIPGTPGCYASLAASCAEDPNSAAYKNFPH